MATEITIYLHVMSYDQTILTMIDLDATDPISVAVKAKKSYHITPSHQHYTTLAKCADGGMIAVYERHAGHSVPLYAPYTFDPWPLQSKVHMWYSGELINIEEGTLQTPGEDADVESSGHTPQPEVKADE